MEFVDKAFARRLEATEEVPQVHHARLYQKLYPEVNAAAEEICGGHMVFAGVGSPIGREQKARAWPRALAWARWRASETANCQQLLTLAPNGASRPGASSRA